MRFRGWSFAGLLALGLFVLAMALPAPAKADWFANKVNDALARYTELFNAGDAAGLAELYAEDAQLMAPHAAAVEGREAIRKFWEGVFGMGKASFALTTLEAFNNGTLGYSLGGYTLSIAPAEGDAMTDEGKYVIVWKRGPGGAWQLAVDIFNTNMAPPAGQGAANEKSQTSN